MTTLQAKQLVQGLGGSENIKDLESCIVRIRAIVHDPAKVDEATIRGTNPLGVVFSGQYVQIIVGKESDEIVAQMDELINPSPVSAT